MLQRQFRPPKTSILAVRTAYLLLPSILRARRIERVEIDSGSLSILRDVKVERVLVCPNHPTNNEPAIVFGLSRQAGTPFFYVACHEAFCRLGGFWGWIIQRLGAYSLVRGTMDRQSFSTTRELLTRPLTKLVIFPEGEVYSQNDSLLPFQAGVIQLAFWSLEDLRRGEGNGRILVLPIAIRYRYLQDMSGAINAALARLEEAVGIQPVQSDVYGRIRGLGEAVVSKLGTQYGVAFPEGTSLGERMDRIKRMQLEIAADLVGVKVKGQNLAEDMRAVINAVHQVTQDSSDGRSAYDFKLWQEQRAHIQPALHELDRLENWIAVYDGYIAADPTQERMLHTIRRMEVEVLGKPVTDGPQECSVRVGEPIDLSTHMENYCKDRKGTVAHVTQLLESEVQSKLTQLSEEHRGRS